MAKHHVPEILELSEHSEQHLLDALNGEADLPCVLIAASFLDYALAAILKKFFIEGSTAQQLIAPSGAIGDFKKKAELCYVLGLIPKDIMQTLSTICEIRNLFAHQYNRSFEQADVEKLCHELVFPSPSPMDSYSRMRFTGCVITIFNCLVIICMQTDRRPIKSPWKIEIVNVDSPKND